MNNSAADQDQVTDIPLGASFDFMILGFVLFVTTLILAALAHALFLLLLPLFISVLISKKGIEFDKHKRKMRLYYRGIGFKLGSWIPYCIEDELLLHKNSSYHSARGFKGLTKWGGSGWSYSFMIVMVRTDADKIELQEFTDYKEAQIFLERVSVSAGLKAVNQFEADVEESRSKPRRR